MRKTLILTLLLAACSAQSQDAIARGAARSTVTKIVVDRFPGAPVEPVLDCVIDNASATQIYALAADTIGGPTESSIQIVADVVQKPETIRCLSTTALRRCCRGRGRDDGDRCAQQHVTRGAFRAGPKFCMVR